LYLSVLILLSSRARAVSGAAHWAVVLEHGNDFAVSQLSAPDFLERHVIRSKRLRSVAA
jgi:hypothetical protein